MVSAANRSFSEVRILSALLPTAVRSQQCNSSSCSKNLGRFADVEHIRQGQRTPFSSSAERPHKQETHFDHVTWLAWWQRLLIPRSPIPGWSPPHSRNGF